MASKDWCEVSSLSDTGRVRLVNEDNFGSHAGEYGRLFVVCDGMGGYRGGKLASSIAVEKIVGYFSKVKKGDSVRKELQNAFAAADHAIKQRAKAEAELSEMGSTCVTLVLDPKHAYFAHTGDSRIYLFRNGELQQMTRDHSLVQQMLDGGLINEAQARNHPKKNVVIRSLGTEKPDPEISHSFRIYKRDRFLLCSDGLAGYAEERDIKDILSENSLDRVCRQLVQLVNDRGGKDNVTVMVIDIVKGKMLPAHNPLRNKIVQLSLAALFLVIACGFLVVRFFILKK